MTDVGSADVMLWASPEVEGEMEDMATIDVVIGAVDNVVCVAMGGAG